MLCKGKQDQSRPSWNHEAVGGGGVWGVRNCGNCLFLGKVEEIGGCL